ncbi:trypsin-like peptidase domain-containing protein [Caulobacter sp. SL161]|uniref:trypsin-like serine peptidase n=1 Tax=Caulobacter sp. SL161 TaxID=2995156 RepID=UPI00227454A9|nr:trypsin-like peptidase domain-containing protein [Caulobacter sp. SL161]MCY1649182.1 trypsin-like peptidase domain-containing protein [Caulobacter sp. SL161]
MNETNGGGSLEIVPGFDAYRARNAGLVLQTAPGAPSEDFRTESVFGPDGRVPVPDTTALPWRCIALLTITYQSGATARGTGWFYGPRTLGTAGHNLRHAKHGRATSILVSPGWNGAAAPFGTFAAASIHCHPTWLANAGPDNLDFGVITLNDPMPGQRLGWFGIAAYDSNQLLPLLVNVCGYPGDRNPRTQYFNGGRLHDVTSEFLMYPFDTEVGMSGSPIFALFKDQRIVVGIHTGGTNQVNRARRIDASLYEFLTQFL